MTTELPVENQEINEANFIRDYKNLCIKYNMEIHSQLSLVVKALPKANSNNEVI